MVGWCICIPGSLMGFLMCGSCSRAVVGEAEEVGVMLKRAMGLRGNRGQIIAVMLMEQLRLDWAGLLHQLMRAMGGRWLNSLNAQTLIQLASSIQ